MKRQFFSFLFLLSLFLGVSAQTEEARQIDEFAHLNCEDLLARSDVYANELERNPTKQLYIIFYEGKHISYKHSKKNERNLVNPRRGEALNKTKAVTLYLTKWRKIAKERFVLIDGGYDTEYRVEVWLVPVNGEAPKPSPQLKEKDIKFRKGKPPRVADCQGYYSSI